VDRKEESGLKYRFGEFEGPLDLLLYLIKKNEVNIYDIPIARITSQYLEYLEYASTIDLDNTTEFYVLAATLLYIKSRLLLPVDLDSVDDIEDPRQELVEKLIEYQKYKKLGELIAVKESESEWLLERRVQQLPLPFSKAEGVWEEVSVWDLLGVFSSLISSLTSQRLVDLYEEVTVKEKITLIYEFFEDREEFPFTDLIQHGRSVMELICSFLAILDLAKRKHIVLYQNRLFGDIRIGKR
jgi:segregation and condensation protein A